MKMGFSASLKPVVAILLLVKMLFCWFGCFQVTKAYLGVGLREGSPRKRRHGHTLSGTEESGLEWMVSAELGGLDSKPVHDLSGPGTVDCKSLRVETRI